MGVGREREGGGGIIHLPGSQTIWLVGCARACLSQVPTPSPLPWFFFFLSAACYYSESHPILFYFIFFPLAGWLAGVRARCRTRVAFIRMEEEGWMGGLVCTVFLLVIWWRSVVADQGRQGESCHVGFSLPCLMSSEKQEGGLLLPLLNVGGIALS